MSLLFNMLSRFVITFLSRSKQLLIAWLQLPSAVILEPLKIKSATVSSSIFHEVMRPDAMILVFWMLTFKPTFPLSSFTFIKRLYFLFNGMHFLKLEVNYFTILHWFCHTSTWIRHRYNVFPILTPPPSSLPVPSLWVIPVHQPQASSIMHWTWTGDLFHILYMFQCHFPKSSHPLPLPQSPKDCSIHLCLFPCLAYRVIITIFLNSTYMC